MSVYAVKKGTLEYLAADGLKIPHCFTTRLGGVSTGYAASLNIGWNREENSENVAENFRILGDALGFSTKKLVLTRQTHSDIVRQVTSQDAVGFNNRDYPECDALITNEPGTALCIFTADCTPVLLWDSVSGAVGAAHAGWRGTVSKIAAKTALRMVESFGSRPENLRAAVGPNIAACCFETDRDVPDAVLQAYGKAAEPYIRKKGEKFHLDLKALNALALREVGVREIDISSACTACENQRFWSHRVTGGIRGSQGAIIVCKEVQP